MIDTSLKLAAACPFPQTYSPNFRDEPKKVNQLLDILEERNSAKGSAATDGVSGSGHSPAFATAENRTAANIEQMSGMIPRSAYRTSSDVELWPHSPQNQRRYR
jgi:hypothetical protein